MLVNASDREWRGQLSYLRRAGSLKVESDMGRRPGGNSGDPCRITRKLERILLFPAPRREDRHVH